MFLLWLTFAWFDVFYFPIAIPIWNGFFLFRFSSAFLCSISGILSLLLSIYQRIKKIVEQRSIHHLMYFCIREKAQALCSTWDIVYCIVLLIPWKTHDKRSIKGVIFTFCIFLFSVLVVMLLFHDLCNSFKFDGRWHSV